MTDKDTVASLTAWLSGITQPEEYLAAMEPGDLYYEEVVEYASTVHQMRERLRTLIERAGIPDWAYPLRPFRDPEDWTSKVERWDIDGVYRYWRGEPVVDFLDLPRADQRVEQQVPSLLQRATVAHEQHVRTHPHCLRCEERFLRWLYPCGWSASPERGEGAVAARARGWLLEQALPKEPKVEEQPVQRAAIATPWPHDEEEDTVWVVKNLVPARRVGILFGPPGSMKSFLAFDLAATLASGAETFHGHEVGTWSEPDAEGTQDPVYLPDGPVLYLPGEGRSGYFGRRRAWEQARGRQIDDDYLHLGNWMPQLGDEEDFQILLDYVAEHRFSLVVVDTLSTAAEGTEENSASEMGLVVNRCHALAQASGGTVLVVHHTGHDESRARGSSVLRANVDFMLKMKREEQALSCSVVKMKDGPDDLVLDLTWSAVGSSLVLDVPARGLAPTVWKSTSLQDALWAFVKGQVDSGIGMPTQTDLVALGKDEPFGVSRTTVQNALADLCKVGLLTVHGQGKETKRYAPGPKPWPSQQA